MRKSAAKLRTTASRSVLLLISETFHPGKAGIFLFSCFCFLSTLAGFSQGLGVNTTGAPPAATAGLDVDFPNKGLLIPRMTKAQRDLIVAPAISLLIYQTDNGAGYYYFNGLSWNILYSSSSGTAWSVSGNSGTNPDVDFVGTTDGNDLVFRTGGTEWMRILSGGNVVVRTDVTDNSRMAMSIKDDNDVRRLVIRSDGHIAINQNDAESGSIDIIANGSSEGYRLDNPGECNSIRLWLASEDGTDGNNGLAYLTRGGDAPKGICIDDGCDDYHYGGIGICLDDDGSGHNSTDPPNSTLQVNGSFSARVNMVTGDYAVTNRDYFIKVETGGSDKTLTLPSAGSCIGRTYIIKKTDASSGNIIIQPAGSETIDDNSSYSFSDQYTSVSIISDGSNWLIMGQFN